MCRRSLCAVSWYVWVGVTGFWVDSSADLYVGSIDRDGADYLARVMLGRERHLHHPDRCTTLP
jgi:hypothetical protein